MIKEKINGTEIIYDKKYIEEKDIIKNNFKKLSGLISFLWGLNEPHSFTIFITNSYIRYTFYAYSFVQKLIILIILPYWYTQIRKTVKDIGAIGFNAKKPSILIKPMKFIESIDSNIGKLIYKEVNTIQDGYKHGYVSLMTAIKSYDLKIPMWIRSGLCSITIEKFLTKDIVKKETISILNKRNMQMDYNNINTAYPHVVGYWTVRYLEENYPGFLKETFKKYRGEEIVEQIILKLGLDSDNYWEQLGELLYENYKHLLEK